MRKKRTNIETLQAEGLEIELVRSSQRRTLSLEVNANGIRARAPWRMSEHDIRSFIRLKREWLHRTLQAQPAPKEALVLADGVNILLQGNEYPIRIVHQRGAVRLQNNTIVIPIVRSHLSQTESVRRKLTTWLKMTAKSQLEDQVKARLTEMLPKQILPNIKVRDYRRRWGSCDHRGDLSFNWRIIQAPQEIINYVVVHEIAHLQEFNHSPKFWRIVARHDPNWQQHQRWLSDHGADLYRF